MVSYRRNDYKPFTTEQEKEFINSLIPGLDFENLSEDDYIKIFDVIGYEYGLIWDESRQNEEKCSLCEYILSVCEDKLGL